MDYLTSNLISKYILEYKFKLCYTLNMEVRTVSNGLRTVSESTRDKNRIRAREWNRNHVERVRHNSKNWRAKNLKYATERAKIYGQTLQGKSVLKKAQNNFNLRNPWYKTFYCAKRRCEDSKDISYQYYGGRGIKFEMTKNEVYKLWLRDKGYNLDRPSIDRINSVGNYTWENCRFIEHIDNCRQGARRAAETKRRKRENFVQQLRLKADGKYLPIHPRLKPIVA